MVMCEGFHYWYRRYFGWLPLQMCMVCGAWYWGGLPRWWIVNGRLTNTWQASWMDYCSRACCDEDMDRLI